MYVYIYIYIYIHTLHCVSGIIKNSNLIKLNNLEFQLIDLEFFKNMLCFQNSFFSQFKT